MSKAQDESHIWLLVGSHLLSRSDTEFHDRFRDVSELKFAPVKLFLHMVKQILWILFDPELRRLGIFISTPSAIIKKMVSPSRSLTVP